MPLTEQEKQRIRDEEVVRLETRDEYRRKHGLPSTAWEWKTALFWVVLICVAVLLWTVLRTR